MAKEGSVAPKERVNIVYKPATGGAQEEVELPLKLFMLGDFTGREDDTPIEERDVININKDNYNEVMRGMDLSTEFNVKDTLSGKDDSEIPVQLRFNDLKDFTPDSLARQVPELNKLLELRDALVALKGPLGNVPAFRRTLEKIVTDDGARQKIIDEIKANAPEEESSEEENKDE